MCPIPPCTPQTNLEHALTRITQLDTDLKTARDQLDVLLQQRASTRAAADLSSSSFSSLTREQQLELDVKSYTEQVAELTRQRDELRAECKTVAALAASREADLKTLTASTKASGACICVCLIAPRDTHVPACTLDIAL